VSYVARTLATREQVIKRANFNWTYNFEAWFWLFSSWVPVAFALIFWFEQLGAPIMSPAELQTYAILAGSGAVLGFLVWFSHMIRVWTTEIVVTSYRFVYKTGWLNGASQEGSLNKTEESNLSQSLIGRILGFGTIILRGTGVGVIELPEVDDPVDFRRTIENAKSKLRDVSPDERDGSAD